MSEQHTPSTSVAALLLTTPGCTHCASMKRVLQKLLDDATLQHLEIVDIVAQPEFAERYGVRSVPWLKLGPIVLTGAHSESELRDYLAQLSSDEGVGRYLERLLMENDLDLVIDLIRENPSWLKNLLQLVMSSANDMKVRLGVSAVFETFEGKPMLQALCPEFAELATNPEPHIRADAAHFLSLTHSPNALPHLQKLATDTDANVREIAEDAIADQ